MTELPESATRDGETEALWRAAIALISRHLYRVAEISPADLVGDVDLLTLADFMARSVACAVMEDEEIAQFLRRIHDGHLNLEGDDGS